jgi:hypothetical protein
MYLTVAVRLRSETGSGLARMRVPGSEGGGCSWGNCQDRPASASADMAGRRTPTTGRGATAHSVIVIAIDLRCLAGLPDPGLSLRTSRTRKTGQTDRGSSHQRRKVGRPFLRQICAGLGHVDDSAEPQLPAERH